MDELPTLTHELARRINRVGAEIAVSQYGSPDNVVRFGETIALKAGHKNGVYCFSSEDLTYLDEILAFFGSDAINPAFYLYFTLPGIACFRASGKVAATIK